MSTDESKCSLLSSSETIGSNHDILTEILLRIPAVPLLTFKSVSKQWLSIISDPKFHVSHMYHRQKGNISPTPTALLLNNGYCSTPEFQLVPLKHDALSSKKVPFLDYLNVPRVKVVQSCNGLLLCSSSYLFKPIDQMLEELDLVSDEGLKLIDCPGCFRDYSPCVVTDKDRGFRFFVCNPTIRQYKRIPLPSHVSNTFDVSLSLAFDPLKSPHYKVICIHEVKADEPYSEIFVYSSETEAWRGLHIRCRRPYPIDRCNGVVFLNGAVHWISFYFHVDSMKRKVMPMPPIFSSLRKEWWDILYFGESRGHLHMAVSRNRLALEFDVLEMESDYCKWFVRHRVNLHSVRMQFPELVWHREMKSAAFSVLSVVRAEIDEDSMIALFVDGRALSYDTHDQTAKILCELDSRERVAGFNNGSVLDYEGRDSYQYFESLYPV